MAKNRGDCSKCGAVIDGAHYSYCKACFSAYRVARYVPKPRKPCQWDDPTRLRAQKREWYEQNREAILEEGKQERLDAKAAIERRCLECGAVIPPTMSASASHCSSACTQRRLGREWAQQNPEKVREAQRQHYKRHPEKLQTKNTARRVRKRDAFVEPINPSVVLERSNGVCGICGDPVDPMNFHVDHVVPLARGGLHAYANVQAAHPRCNQSKGARMPEAA